MELIKATVAGHIAYELSNLRDDLERLERQQEIRHILGLLNLTKEETEDILKIVKDYIRERMIEREKELTERLDKM